MDLSAIDANIISLWEEFGPITLTFLRNVGIAALVIIGGKITITVSHKLINKARTGRICLNNTFAVILRKGIKYAIVVVCLIMILDILGVNTTGLLALLGAAGIAIGFALRDTLANIAAGIVLIFLRPFQVDDFIECSGITGTIKDIGIFTTEVQTPDGVFVSMPNSCLWGVPLKNFTHNDKRRIDITINISYTDSVDTAFQAVNQLIQQDARFLADPPSQVMVQSLGESGTGITLRAWVNTADYWPTYWDHMKKMKEGIQEAGLTIALPKRVISVTSDNQELPRNTPVVF